MINKESVNSSNNGNGKLKPLVSPIEKIIAGY